MSDEDLLRLHREIDRRLNAAEDRMRDRTISGFDRAWDAAAKEDAVDLTVQADQHDQVKP
jgi:hypothetical protein